MKAILFDTHGDESVLRWDDAPDPRPGPGQVVLAVRATSVNRADVLQRRGFYPPPPGASPILGLEAAGLVHAVGAGVEGWKIGDPAMALLAGGGYAEQVAVDARHLLPVPRAVGLPDAGAVPEVYVTAWLNLWRLGGLRAGERVLIHGGSGGVGTAAIQLARARGADVWTTAGGPERAARCVEVGAHRGLDYHREDFVAALREAGGAHLILDVIGAKYLARNLDALAPDGRLVIIGLQGGTKGELDLGKLLSKRLTVAGSTLRARSADDKAALLAAFREEVWPLLDRGDLRPLIDARLPLSEAAEAHRRLDSGQVFGKILLINADVM
jgi:putative PIG3 family NAD(P)H quinone oxidoreductase